MWPGNTCTRDRERERERVATDKYSSLRRWFKYKWINFLTLTAILTLTSSKRSIKSTWGDFYVSHGTFASTAQHRALAESKGEAGKERKKEERSKKKYTIAFTTATWVLNPVCVLLRKRSLLSKDPESIHLSGDINRCKGCHWMVSGAIVLMDVRSLVSLRGDLGGRTH